MAAGELDPLVGRSRARLWMLMRMLKRKGAPTKRKYPVTATMLKRVKKYLWGTDPHDEDTRWHVNITQEDVPALWAGIVTGWMFLPRRDSWGGTWCADPLRGVFDYTALSNLLLSVSQWGMGKNV